MTIHDLSKCPMCGRITLHSFIKTNPPEDSYIVCADEEGGCGFHLEGHPVHLDRVCNTLVQMEVTNNEEQRNYH